MDISSNNNFISQSVVLLLLCFTFNGISMASDTIYAGQSLSGNQTLTSPGIWYKNLRPRIVVWVTNRKQPASDSYSSALQLFRNGSLALLDRTKFTIWSTRSAAAVSNSTTAVLLDNGNFVIRDESDSFAVLWQSFDHPTDTWLPGAKLGYNRLTKEKLILTPWRNPQNPAPGIFSLEIEQAGSRVFLFRNGSAISVWDWHGDNHYCFYFQVNLNSVVNENESSLTYNLIDPNSFVRYKLLNGLLKFYNGSETIDTWGALGQCTNDVSCGAFSICDSQNLPHCQCLEGFEPKIPEDWEFGGYSYGCVRKTPLQCSDVGNHKFLGVPDVSYSQNSESLKVKSIEECRLACSRDCSITAFAYNNDCMIWKGDVFDLYQLPYSVTKLIDGIKIHIRVADSTDKVKRKTTWIAIGVFAGFLSISTILVAFFKRNRKATENFSKNLGNENALMLDWKDRYHITIGTARGLAYLHEECRDCIIHCDIKPDNIFAFIAPNYFGLD
ncbi:unnamed protein product [Malus baccata var. baccata]